MRKYLRWPLFIVLAALVVAALVPTLPLLHTGKMAARAVGPSGGQVIPHPAHRPKPLPHHMTAGVNRAHLPTLAMLEGPVQRARTNHAHPNGALMSSSLNTAGTSTLFFDDFESGAPGWTTAGDNLVTPYYQSGHEFWNLVQNPQTLSVPTYINPKLVIYPDSSGTLPTAYSGTHAWWYGDNPAVDTRDPYGASMTYLGNRDDWGSNQNVPGGVSYGPNSASLISPSIDLTSVSNATLTFEEWWEIESVDPAHFDMMYVDVSTDGGNTWDPLGVLNPAQNPTGGSTMYPYTNNGLDTPAGWHIASVNLTPYVGSNVQVRFRFDSVDQTDNGFRGWLIDDVGVYSTDGSTPLISTVTPDSGMVGSTVTISGHGFGTRQGTSKVNFKNIPAQVESWSDSQIVVTVPSGTVRGGVEVTVNGVKSNNVTFIVNGSLNISTSTSQIGSPVSFTGQGFLSGETVKIYLNGVTGKPLTSVAADSSGNIATQSVNVPVVSGGSDLVLAMGLSSSITAGATLTITPTLSTTATTVQPAQSIALSGEGFAANEEVNLYLDGQYSFYPATTDSKGEFSGNLPLPNSSIAYGKHTIIGEGDNSELFASTPSIFITPAITDVFPSGATAGPGSSIELYGTGFVGNDTIYAYLGTTSGPLLGRALTLGSNLSLPLTLPTNLKTGTYTIILLSKNTGVTTTKSFQIGAPTLQLFQSGIRAGQQVSISLSNFLANEQVSISWNANGGQQITSLQTDRLGGIPTDQINITPPIASAGMYTLTATGETSGLQATATLNVGPGIAVASYSVTPGSTITVTGGGFTPNEQIKVYLQHDNTDLMQVTSDASGAFSLSFKLPLHPSINSDILLAVGTIKTDQASIQLYYVLPYFSTGCCSGSYGEPVTFYGSNYFAGEQVNIIWGYHQSYQRLIDTATAASDGRFTITLLLPSAPSSLNKQNVVNIAAVGQTSKLAGIDNFYVQPGLSIKPDQGPAGTQVAIKGGDFGATETVRISYQNIEVASVTTNQNGAFSATIIVPKEALIGSATIQATGESTGYVANGSFAVLPTITLNPTTGASSTTITVSGTNFTFSGNVNLYWYDPGTTSRTFLSTVVAPGGSFTTKVTPPGNLVSGATYYVQAYDWSTEVSTQVAFVAQ